MRILRSSAPLSLLAVLACAAPAEAAQELRGKTSQQRAIVVRLADDGHVTFARFDWVARCRGGNFRLFDGRTNLGEPMQTSTPTEFSDAGSYSERFKGGIRARISVTGRGTRQADGSWAGTFRITKLVARRRGKRVGTCRSSVIRWTVR